MDTTKIKLLREKTKASYADCKKALVLSNDNIEAAENIIREKGYAVIEKSNVDKSAQGIIHSYIHPGNRIGTIVEVKCSTDFVAKTDEFKQFAKEVSLQVAAMKPKYISRADIPLEHISSEVGFRITRLTNDGHEENSDEFERLLEAEMELWYSEVCLLEQTYIKDNKKKVQDLLAELAAKVNETCRISRFERWEIGVENNKEAIVESEYKNDKLKTSATLLLYVWLIVLFLTIMMR